MGKLSKNRIISLLAAICMLLVALMPLQTTQAKVMISGDMTVNVGQNCPVVVSGTSRKPKWSSSNKAVATINSKGWLNPLSPGKTTITAKIGSKSYKCKVTVTYFKDVSISVNKSNSYKKASGNVRNAFSGGQAADLALSCFGMDQPGGCIADGKLVLLDAGKLLIYNKLPKSSAAMAKPSLTVGNGESHSSSNKYYYFGTGDYNQCVYAGGKLYVSLYNANKVAVFNGLPKKSTAKPNYALSGKVTGSTLLSNGLIMNPNVATNGKNLVAVSDFDWTLSVWKNIPDSSAVKADMVYTFDPAASPVDVQYYGKKLVVATRNSLYIWNNTPTGGQKWNSAVVGTIGTVNMQGIDAIATGGKYFFISDSKTNKVYVYDKVPNRTTKPVATIKGAHGSLASNGTLLTVSGNVASSSVGGDLCKTVTIYDLSDLKNITKQQVHEFTYKGEHKTFNFATDCVITKDGKLVVADQGDNYVLIWNDYKNAVSGSEPDCVLGRGSTYYESSMLTENIPGRPVDTIGVTGKDSLVMPTFLAYDGNYLWVGEFKFSSRLLRFSGKL